ncbi:hypothetical protein ACSU1N_01715 [Thermogladius sp. 4427co]|uniref:hypothetical protein n=1 Tax=Thermogladius sp. 4427co TaxID=3450718 RepID=UPI003F7A7C49
MSESGKKKLIYVSEDVIDKLARISYARGESLARLVDKVLRRVIEAFEMGYDIEEIVRILKVVEVEKKLGSIFVPHEVFEVMLENNSDLEKVKEAFYESGRAYGIYIKNKYNGSLDIVKSFIEKSRWDFNEVLVMKDTNTVRIMCVSTVMGDTETDLVVSFIKGLMTGLDYAIDREEIARGIIVIDFKRKSGES